jgi:hypothetical protein
MDVRMMRFAAIAALGIALVAAACGTTQPTDATKPAAHSAAKREQAASVKPATFATEASTICSSMALFSQKLVGSTGKVSDRQVGRLVQRSRADLGRLVKLAPPPGKASAFRLMLENYRLMLTGLAAAKASDDESVLSDLAATVVAGTRGSRAARRAGLNACAFFPEIRQPSRDPGPIIAATRALLVRGARVIKTDCSDQDSCRIEFSSAGPTRSRLRAAVKILRAKGWSHLRTGHSPVGSSWATAYRNDLAVEIEILGERRPPHCVHAPTGMYGCTDAIWIHRQQVPSVLTGG